MLCIRLRYPDTLLLFASSLQNKEDHHKITAWSRCSSTMWLLLPLRCSVVNAGRHQHTGRRLCSTTWSYVASSMKPVSGEKPLHT